jgi:hypothetical protein
MVRDAIELVHVPAVSDCEPADMEVVEDVVKDCERVEEMVLVMEELRVGAESERVCVAVAVADAVSTWTDHKQQTLRICTAFKEEVPNPDPSSMRLPSLSMSSAERIIGAVPNRPFGVERVPDPRTK